MPITVPPSPTAAGLGKYGVWPVSYYTGIPNISVPIYQIESGELKVSVSLNYHASGIQVEEMGSWVGLGWSFNAGGVITRTVRGTADELIDGYTTLATRYKGTGILTSYNVATNTDDLTKFNGFAKGLHDSEPDAFSFNFNGKSGSFFLDENNQFRATSHSQLKIVKNPITTAYPYWEILDDVGVTYILGENEGTEISNVLSTNPSSSYNLLGEIITAWNLTKIISANKKDTIQFTYKDKLERYRRKQQQVVRIPLSIDIIHINPSGYGYGYQNANEQLGDETYSSSGDCQLESIIWKHGVLKITSNTNRDDMMFGKLLDKVEVFNNYSQLLKKIEFIYNNASERVFLNELHFSGSDNLTLNKYQFAYHQMALPSRLSNSQDYWGYYNGVTNPHMIPYETVYDQFQNASSMIGGLPNANRQPSNGHVMAGSLVKITFPTGGYSMFEYEANEYSKIGDGTGQHPINNTLGGGQRIKTIRSYTGYGLAEERNFEYKNGLTSTGTLFSRPKFASVSFAQTYSGCKPGDESAVGFPMNFIATATPSSTVPLSNTQGASVGYSLVTEFISGGNNGKIEYLFSLFDDTWNDVTFNSIYQNYDRPPFLPSTSNDYKRGFLLEQTTFKKEGSDYIKVGSLKNTYDYNDNPGNRNFYSLKVLKVKSIADSTLVCTIIPPDYFPSFRSFLFAYGFYNIKSAWVKLTSTEERVYHPDGVNYLATTKNLFYDNLNHINTTKIEEVNSKNQLKRTEYLYANEMVTSGLDPAGTYQRMINRNMINMLIEQKNSINSTVTERIRKNFSDTWYVDNSVVAPQNIESQIAGNPAEQRLIYHGYDNNGNPTQISKSSDVNVSYVYDYKGSIPIAEVANATVANIAFTSFEADGKGNWNYTGIPASDLTAPTGKKVFTIINSSNNITKSGLSSSTTFIVSYWKKSGTVTVNGSSATSTGRTLNGWTYNEHKVVNPLSGSITVSGTNGLIDELRLYPATAQMTSYTFDPLIGMTSQCDINSKISYFEYDNFQRLMLVRDDNKNVLKKFCYNYAGQPISCDIFTNDDKSGSYTRTNCGSGYTGGTVTVSVPAGMFSSTISKADANSQATAYGQAQANSLGTCTASNVSILCNNNVSMGTVYMQYHNNTTGQMYTFNVSAAGSNINLGTIPAGTYTVSIGTSNNTTSYYFTVACGYYLYGTNATFNNVTVDNTCRVISISPY